LAASIVLVITGTFTPVQAWIGWKRAERALRLERALPSAHLALPIAIAVIVVGVLVLLGVITA
jgi:putative membrane protein